MQQQLGESYAAAWLDDSIFPSISISFTDASGLFDLPRWGARIAFGPAP